MKLIKSIFELSKIQDFSKSNFKIKWLEQDVSIHSRCIFFQWKTWIVTYGHPWRLEQVLYCFFKLNLKQMSVDHWYLELIQGDYCILLTSFKNLRNYLFCACILLVFKDFLLFKTNEETEWHRSNSWKLIFCVKGDIKFEVSKYTPDVHSRFKKVVNETLIFFLISVFELFSIILHLLKNWPCVFNQSQRVFDLFFFSIFLYHFCSWFFNCFRKSWIHQISLFFIIY